VSSEHLATPKTPEPELPTSPVLTILRREIACHYYELINRAYQEYHITKDVDSAINLLTAQGEVDETTYIVPSVKPKPVRMIYCTEPRIDQTQRVIAEKAELMSMHYNLSDTIGKHAERLVKQTCEALGYTELETRKETHDGIGIGKRDIDVFAKHPTQDYYQDIEVRNRREPVKLSDLAPILKTATLASKKWQMYIRPALVAAFSPPYVTTIADQMGIPIALIGIQLVPETYRDLYEKLNSRLALNVLITDEAPQYLTGNINRYIKGYHYKTSREIWQKLIQGSNAV
jgi:hypothetical protein